MAKKAFDLSEDKIQWVNEILQDYKHEYNQAQILVEALAEWQQKKSMGNAIEAAPVGLKDMFAGDKDKLFSAVDTIKSTYISLMTTTSQKLEDKEIELKELYSAQIRELKAKIVNLESNQQSSEDAVQKAQEELETAVKDKDVAIDHLDAANKTIEELKKSIADLEADKELLVTDKEQLIADKAKLNETIVSKDEELKELKALKITNEKLEKSLAEEKVNNQLKEKEIVSLTKEITRLIVVEEEHKELNANYITLTEKASKSESLANSYKVENKTYKDEIKTLKDQLNAERKKIEELYKQLVGTTKKDTNKKI